MDRAAAVLLQPAALFFYCAPCLLHFSHYFSQLGFMPYEKRQGSMPARGSSGKTRTTTLRFNSRMLAIELLRNVCLRSSKNVIIIPPRLALVNPFFIFFQLFCCSVFFFITKGLLGRNRPVIPRPFPLKKVLPCESYPSTSRQDVIV